MAEEDVTFPTPHGIVTWLPPQAAALQAAKDIKYLEQRSTEAAAPGSPAAIVAAFLAALGTLGLLGTSIAGLVKEAKVASVSSVETEVTNLSSSAVVLTTYDMNSTNRWRLAKAMDPLAPGESDSFVVTYPDKDVPFGAYFPLGLTVGNGAGSVPVQVTYQFAQTDFGPWTISYLVDGAGSWQYQALNLSGLTFQATAGTSCPSFSLYATNIATSSGRLSVSIYDLAPPTRTS